MLVFRLLMLTLQNIDSARTKNVISLLDNPSYRGTIYQIFIVQNQ